MAAIYSRIKIKHDRLANPLGFYDSPTAPDMRIIIFGDRQLSMYLRETPEGYWQVQIGSAFNSYDRPVMLNYLRKYSLKTRDRDRAEERLKLALYEMNAGLWDMMMKYTTRGSD